MIEISRWDNNEVIHSGDFNSIKECLEDGVKKGISFYRADLTIAYLNNTGLIDTSLIGADLIGADLIGANLSGANLSGANLTGANLRAANLSKANLYGTVGIYIFTAYDTSKRIVYCVKHKETWMINAGCFWGTLEELETKVRATHNSKVYLANIELLKGLRY